jgi:hypothetical protein
LELELEGGVEEGEAGGEGEGEDMRSGRVWVCFCGHAGGHAGVVSGLLTYINLY